MPTHPDADRSDHDVEALEALRRALPEPDEADLVEDHPEDEPSEEDHGPLHNPWWAII